nr:hypothetical protein Iba_chr02bCG0940 [Ipomoea batatas]
MGKTSGRSHRLTAEGAILSSEKENEMACFEVEAFAFRQPTDSLNTTYLYSCIPMLNYTKVLNEFQAPAATYANLLRPPQPFLIWIFALPFSKVEEMKQLSSSTVIGKKRKVSSSSTQERSSVVNTTIRNTTPNSILGEPYESRTSERPKFKGKQQLVTGSPNLPSFGKMNNTPRSSLNMTLGSDKAIPLSDITNCIRIRQRKKIKGALEVTVASRLENNVNVSPRNYNTQSYFLENSTTNIPQESNTKGIICRDLSQDFDEVIENEGN